MADIPERGAEDDSPQWSAGEAAARIALERMRTRKVWWQGMGVLQRWSGCDQAQASAWLREGHDTRAGRDAEASRIVAVLNAQATPGVDLDTEWD